MAESRSAPLPGRERAAAFWRTAGIASLAVALIAGLGVLAAEIWSLPSAFTWLSLSLAAVALIGAPAATVGYGRAHGLSWRQSLRHGARAVWQVLTSF